MNLKFFIDNLFLGFLQSLKGLLSIWTIDALLEKKLTERYERVLEAKEKGFRVPNHRLKPKKPPKVAKKVVQSCFINGGIFLTSLLIFYNVFLPIVLWVLYVILPQPIAGFRDVVGYMFNFLFGSFWIIPVYIATRVANCLWWQDIADALFKLRPNISHQVRFQIRNGTGDQLSSFQGQTSPETFKWSFSMLLTDLCYSITIDTFFLIQATVFSMLPLGYLSYLFSIFHLSLLYSLYAFEYIWWAQRHDAKDRLIRIQSNVPYFLGFGLPLTLLSSAHHSALINGCVYSILFPFLILSAFEAQPPVFMEPATSDVEGAAVPKQLPIFSPVITISEFVFGIFKKRINFKNYLVSSQNANA
ncbi:etoposide-induced protein 2.4 homolog [Symsagittifera roscoffensis]|uniref:etoposide-induced protein 2.4 homolog n=1 Tax=Symsagittifera roscoffensis TaxID=84072 RepID=UPI00307BC575